MQKNNLEPHKITQPIQLMAAWFTMLIVLSSVLLSAAYSLDEPDWLRPLLVISTLVVILLVIVLAFLMQTIFRPNLQDGDRYSEWLKYKDQQTLEIERLSNELESATNHFEKSRIKEHESTSVELTELTQFISNIGEAQREILDKLEMSRGEKQSSLSDEFQRLSQNRKLSLYTCSLSNLDGAEILSGMINEYGIAASINKRSSATIESKDAHKGIWVGKNVPSDIVIDLIDMARKFWPHLEYVSISGDNGEKPPEYVHSQLYIGGATSTCLERGYTKWSSHDFEALKSCNDRNLHTFIRKIG